ncbi:hypothetical protein SAMN04488556_3371 [Halostagnicola kamekurae]|uniref:Uncharacterized protein n=1 Tax=Halostagnicola kamekurae TaxID=619731 RepID=A0A1I6TRW9_9EURY|nr:hypothetical protein SAMN04488556_3371 [Halostagnicola kamekurae]
MFPIKTFVSKRRAYCPRFRGESVIRYGSYRVFQWYLCKDCDRTFTISRHGSIESAEGDEIHCLTTCSTL